jgi:hypothetical protein
METIVENAQLLVYSLLALMPSHYQQASLEAQLGLFLEAQGHPLPQHTQLKSASSLSRFLNLFGFIPRPLGRNTSRGLPRGFIPLIQYVWSTLSVM